MKIWATSCLHISYLTGFEVPMLRQVGDYIKDGDVVILAGDIVDPGPTEYRPREELSRVMALEALFRNQTVLFCPGNHDIWFHYYQPPNWVNFGNVLTTAPVNINPSNPSNPYYIFGFPGYNYEGPSWAHHHLFERMPIMDEHELRYRVRSDSPKLIFSHYPFWWGHDGDALPSFTRAIVKAKVPKIVFGHLHEPHKWADMPLFCPQGPLVGGPQVYNVAAVNKESPFVLVDEI